MADKKSIRERFEEKFEPIPECGCWIWTGAVLENGYGAIFVDSKRKAAKAHRIAWELYRGPVPEGLHVLHKCDVKLCVNPIHLYVGTHAQNMRDKTARLRIHGERNPKARLTDNDVMCIRAEPYSRGVCVRLAKQFGVTSTAIWQIRRNLRWQHLR